MKQLLNIQLTLLLLLSAMVFGADAIEGGISCSETPSIAINQDVTLRLTHDDSWEGNPQKYGYYAFSVPNNTEATITFTAPDDGGAWLGLSAACDTDTIADQWTARNTTGTITETLQAGEYHFYINKDGSTVKDIGFKVTLLDDTIEGGISCSEAPSIAINQDVTLHLTHDDSWEGNPQKYGYYAFSVPNNTEATITFTAPDDGGAWLGLSAACDTDTIADQWTARNTTGTITETLQAGEYHFYINKDGSAVKNVQLKVTGDISNDAQYLYQKDQLGYVISSDNKSIGMWNKGGSDLINTEGKTFFKASEHVGIDYHIEKKVGGFDVVYTLMMNNTIEKNHNIATLQIPNIIFHSEDTLNILNPLDKHYLEKRELSKENSYYTSNSYWKNTDGNRSNNKLNKLNKNYFPVAYTIRVFENNKYLLEDSNAYGDQFVYSPVIVATDDKVAVGSSLNSDFIKHKIGTKMFIDKISTNSWTYRYELIAYKELGAGQKITLTIPVRFAPKKNWIFTLYPYKKFFNDTYKKDMAYLGDHPKDVRPIQGISFSYPEDTTSKPLDDRHWAWITITNGANEIDKTNSWKLEDTLNTFGKLMKNKGFERCMIWNFTGTYSKGGEDDTANGKYKGNMHQQLPFQFLGNPKRDDSKTILKGNFKNSMQNILDGNIHNTGISYFKDYGIGYDWGVSGQVPVDNKGDPLALNQFRPYDLKFFTPDNDNDLYGYAKKQLNQVTELKNTVFEPKFIRLDALNRMENIKDRIKWVHKIKEKLPNTKLAAESSIDYMHAQIGIINQLDSTETFPDTIEDIENPDFLAMYLNPKMEIVVNLDNSFLRKGIPLKYVKKLVSWGYTPLIKYHDDTLFPDNNELNKSALVDVHDLGNNKIDPCLDGVSDNGEWPYDEKCRDRDFNQ